ncbi:hypothetical protein LCGC14_2237440 [marine sediment metagenome]|uniref:Uncharacterized protein n=1 Tax=marine sediment metagenome TaxID=412755 RepID=A0A0F9DU08_9ZZZZ
MAFNDIIYFTARPHVSQTRYNEVEETFRRNLGQRIETGVRNRIDPGITFRGHQRARSVKVRLTDAGKLTIKDGSPEKAVLKPDEGRTKGRPVFDREDTVNDLFTPGNGVPTATRDRNGQLRVAFRTVRDTDMFGRHQERQDSNIKRIVDNVVQTSTIEVMNESVRETERRYPSEQVGSEEIVGDQQ